jgi:hypothetical protein
MVADNVPGELSSLMMESTFYSCCGKLDLQIVLDPDVERRKGDHSVGLFGMLQATILKLLILIT